MIRRIFLILLLIGQKLTQIWRIKSVLRIHIFPLKLLSCVQKALKNIQTKFHYWDRVTHKHFIDVLTICPTITLIFAIVYSSLPLTTYCTGHWPVSFKSWEVNNDNRSSLMAKLRNFHWMVKCIWVGMYMQSHSFIIYIVTDQHDLISCCLYFNSIKCQMSIICLHKHCPKYRLRFIMELGICKYF